MPFQLGWTSKLKQNEPDEDVSESSSDYVIKNTLIKLNVDTLKALLLEVSEMRAELAANFEATTAMWIDTQRKTTTTEKNLEAPESPTLSLINDVGSGAPQKYGEIVKAKEGYLYTQKVINSRKDPLIVVHIKSCGMIRSKKAWKRHSSPEAVIRWAKRFDDDKWSKKVVIAVCSACLPFRDQHLIYGRQVPPFWNNNTVERNKGFQQEGYTPKYLYP